jgi:uncharacterized protein YjiS (DUF1127 family)
MTTSTIKLASQDPSVSIRSRFESILAISGLWHARAKQRRRLAELTGSQLEDVGLSVDAARAEAKKPFWRV